MRSMLAEIQERLVVEAHSDSDGRRPACDFEERYGGPNVWWSEGCARCLIAAHAAAHHRPALVVGDIDRNLYTLREWVNDVIRRFSLPLPPVPRPAPVEGDAEEGQQL